MYSLTVENYLKAAWQISNQQTTNYATNQKVDSWVSTGQLAEALGVSPGTVTSMLKSLSESGMVEYRPYEGVKLTDAGEAVALRILRRHRLIELFLVRTLKLTWDQVHEEAEHLEHAVSDFLIDRIDEFLDHPEVDPHGDPIPNAEGVMRGGHQPTMPLSDCPEGSHIRIARVMNQGAEFLRYLTDVGLTLGTECEITDRNPEAGVVTVQTETQRITLGFPAAQQLLVESVESMAKK
ncbi:MAG: metal-dependent transcriptional regulator [Planctomycetaceae bacterium]